MQLISNTREELYHSYLFRWPMDFLELVKSGLWVGMFKNVGEGSSYQIIFADKDSPLESQNLFHNHAVITVLAQELVADGQHVHPLTTTITWDNMALVWCINFQINGKREVSRMHLPLAQGEAHTMELFNYFKIKHSCKLLLHHFV